MEILVLIGLLSALTAGILGPTGVFVWVLKYKILSVKGPLNGALEDIAETHAMLKEDHDILIRIEAAVDRHEVVIERLRKYRHEHASTLTALNLRTDMLEKKVI